LLDGLAHLEATLDFADDADIAPEHERAIHQRIRLSRDTVVTLLESVQTGRIWREGFQLAIAGRPNVGKSSLYNRLIGQEKAIVTPIPGTTRDIIENRLLMGSIPVLLSDTAGLRESTDVVEQVGIRMAQAHLRDADGVLLVVEAQQGWHPEESAILAQLDPATTVIVWNKGDLGTCVEEAAPTQLDWEQTPHVVVSCRTGAGLETLRRLISQTLLTPFHSEEGGIILVARQRDALLRCHEALEEADRLLAMAQPLELVAIPLGEAIQALGELIGAVSHDQLLDRIFSTFCIGK
jgi:tRNA modification GTPase